MDAKTICETAASLVSGDRQKTHGDKLENHRNIAALWSAYLDVPINAKQAALMMALVKIARTKIGDHNPDDYIDLTGYGACAGEIAHRDRVNPAPKDLNVKAQIAGWTPADFFEHSR